MHARLKVPAKNSPALLFLSRGKAADCYCFSFFFFSPVQEEQSRGILGGNFQTRMHNSNKAAGLKETGWSEQHFNKVINMNGYVFPISFCVRLRNMLRSLEESRFEVGLLFISKEYRESWTGNIYYFHIALLVLNRPFL